MKNPLLTSLLLYLFGFQLLQAQSSPDFSTYSYAKIDTFLLMSIETNELSKALAAAEYATQKAAKEFGKKDTTYAHYLGEQGSVYTMQGNFKKAKPLLLKSKALLDKYSSRLSIPYSNVALSLAKYYNQVGENDAAEALFLQCKKISKVLLGEDDINYAGTLNDIAAFFYGIGKYEQAELNYLECQSIVKKTVGEFHPYNAILISNLATMYQKMERYQESEKLYRESLSIIEKIYGKDNYNYSITLGNLAALLYYMERYQESEQLHLTNLKIKEKVVGQNHPQYAIEINNLAFLYEKIGRYEAAKDLYTKSLKIYKQLFGVNHMNYQNTLTNLSTVYAKTNQPDSAYAYLMTAIACNAKQFKDALPQIFEASPLQTKDIYQTAQFKQLPTDKEIAKLKTIEYRDLSQAIASMNTLTNILREQRQKCLANNQKEAAKDRLLTAYNMSKVIMALAEQSRNEFVSKKNKLHLLKESSRVLLGGIVMAEALDDDQYAREAFSFSEQNKSILLTEAINGNRAKILGGLPDSLIQKEILLQTQKDELKKQKFLAKDEATKAALLKQENTLSIKIESFLEKLQKEYPKYHALKYKKITAAASEVQELLDDESMFLEYFVSDTVIFLFAITKEEVNLHTLDINKHTLAPKIEGLRTALSNYKLITTKKAIAYQKFINNAHWCYQNLLSEALEEQEVKNLIIVTDGNLGHLPFGVFLVEPAKQSQTLYKELPYLINDYNISYNYSATLWKSISGKKTHQTNNKMLACAATYPKAPNELGHRPPHLVNLRRGLKPIPAVREEVKSLSELFDGDFLEGKEANERFFKNKANEYGVIHLAMHGLLHPRVPMLSSLAFTENQDSLEDNFLQAYEISRLNLNANLVVLSACETGFGQFEQGEGIISLARSFMYAGTPSLIVSLWQVNDRSTAFIMQQFYQNLSQGLPKDKALRKAKLVYLENAQGIAAHPAYWSAFIQLGDNRPISMSTQSNWTWWVVGGGSLLILIVILGFWMRRPH